MLNKKDSFFILKLYSKRNQLNHLLNQTLRLSNKRLMNKVRFQSVFGASQTFQANRHLSTCHTILTTIRGIQPTGKFYNCLFILSALSFVCQFIQKLLCVKSVYLIICNLSNMKHSLLKVAFECFHCALEWNKLKQMLRRLSKAALSLSEAAEIKIKRWRSMRKTNILQTLQPQTDKHL